MKIGYVRVAYTDAKDHGGFQIARLLEYGCKEENIYIEERTGMAGRRTMFDAMMASVKPGDEVVVWTLDRIGRSIKAAVEVVASLKAKGASFRTLGEGVENIDTNRTSPSQQYLVFDLLERFAEVIEFERGEHNKKRRNPDRANKPSLLLDWRQVEFAQEALLRREVPVKAICEQMGVSPPTLYSYLGPNGELRERGRRALLAKTS